MTADFKSLQILQPTNALFQADTVEGRDGHVLYGIPIDRVLGWLKDR